MQQLQCPLTIKKGNEYNAALNHCIDGSCALYNTGINCVSASINHGNTHWKSDDFSSYVVFSDGTPNYMKDYEQHIMSNNVIVLTNNKEKEYSAVTTYVPDCLHAVYVATPLRLPVLSMSEQIANAVKLGSSVFMHRRGLHEKEIADAWILMYEDPTRYKTSKLFLRKIPLYKQPETKINVMVHKKDLKPTLTSLSQWAGIPLNQTIVAMACYGYSLCKLTPEHTRQELLHYVHEFSFRFDARYRLFTGREPT